MSIDNKFLKVTMLDGSKWKIPIRIIAEHRARYYAEKEHVTFEQSLKFDTLPLFEEDLSEIEEWAERKMNWRDVEKYAEEIKGKELSLEELEYGWHNCPKEIIE